MVLSVAAGANPQAHGLSAAEIAERNVAAQSSLQAWRAVQTISMSGKMAAGGNQRATLRLPTTGHQNLQLPPLRAAISRFRPHITALLLKLGSV